MKQVQRGFTLIELVMVIVILGILAAVALPKFVDLSSQAGDAATKGVAGSISSASAINYAAKLAGATATTISGDTSAVCTTTVMGNLVAGVSFTGSGTPSDSNTYAVTAPAGSATACTAGGVVPCSLLGSKGSSQTAQVVCTAA